MNYIKCPNCGSTQVMLVEIGSCNVRTEMRITIKNGVPVPHTYFTSTEEYYVEDRGVQCTQCGDFLAKDLDDLIRQIEGGEIQVIDEDPESSTNRLASAL